MLPQAEAGCKGIDEKFRIPKMFGGTFGRIRCILSPNMRPFETALLFFITATFVSLVWSRGRKHAIVAACFAAILGAIQILVEKYRWAMLPAYTLVLVFLPWSVSMRRSPEPKAGWIPKLIRGVAIVLIALGCVLAIALPLIFPVFSFPTPTGSHAIGSRLYSFVDPNRKDRIGDLPDAPREIFVQVFYPAQPAQGAKPMPYMPATQDSPGRLFLEYAQLPTFLLDHLSLVSTHTYENAPIVTQEKPFPVIVFNPGYVGYAAQNQTQFEELASHGYVVFSICHPGESVLCVAPDGRAIPYSKKRTSKFLDDSVASADEWNAYVKALGDSSTSVQRRDDAARAFLKKQATAAESLAFWVEDTRFFLEQLKKPVKDDIFNGHIDTDHLGIMGMSFGSGVVSAICSTDPRCKAGAVLDGTGGLSDFDRQTKAPFLMMYSEQAPGANDFVFDRAEGPAYRVLVRGSLHFNFTDFNFFSPLFRQVEFLGKIDPHRMAHVTNSYVLGFFEQHLRGKPNSLLDGTSTPFTEVDFKIRKGSPER